jgi:hypothetical protein
MLQRQEYEKEFTYIGQDEKNDPIIDEKVIYTGKVTNIIYYDKFEAFNNNRIPEWKAKIIGSYYYEKGHNKNGLNKYDFQRNPITLLKLIP